MLRFDVLTLFPGMFAPVLTHSMLKRGQDKGLLTVKVHNLRDFTADRHKVVDDMPYGGQFFLRLPRSERKRRRAVKTFG